MEMDIRNFMRKSGRAEAVRSCIDLDKRVVFFPTDANFADGTWHVPVHGWIYRPTELSRLRRAGLWLVKQALRKHVPRDEKSKALFRERAGAFLVDNERRERVKIRLGETEQTLRCSRANGHFTSAIELSELQVTTLWEHGAPCAQKNARWAPFRAVMGDHDRRVFDGRVRLLPPEGLSVISDIDDTIKVTDVANRRQMLRNTFVREFVSVPEMAAQYRQWEESLGAAFHYVSASPWHLYPFLEEFLAGQGFPKGTFYLRHFRLMPGDLPRMLRSGRHFKLKHTRELLRRFPRRKFYLVGDSGESDPAIYAQLYREFPGQVERILIRDVKDPPGWPVVPERVFKGIPRERWAVFRHVDPITGIG